MITVWWLSFILKSRFCDVVWLRVFFHLNKEQFNKNSLRVFSWRILTRVPCHRVRSSGCSRCHLNTPPPPHPQPHAQTDCYADRVGPKLFEKKSFKWRLVKIVTPEGGGGDYAKRTPRRSPGLLVVRGNLSRWVLSRLVTGDGWEGEKHRGSIDIIGVTTSVHSPRADIVQI